MSGQLATAPTAKRTLRFLHLLFAGIIGLVLPFVCWGAEATPGHPHARAHFVFMTPAQPSAQEVVGKAAELLASGAEHAACVAVKLAGSGGLAGADLPTSQSVPLVLAITLLMLAAIAVLLPAGRLASGGFLCRPTTDAARSWLQPAATPPPR